MSETPEYDRGGRHLAVKQWFMNHPNTDASAEQLSAILGMDTHAIQRHCWTLIHRKGMTDLNVLRRGHRWCYKPGQVDPQYRPPVSRVATVATLPPRPQIAGRMFEELAVTNRGEILVQCEDGSIYKLVEV